MIGMIGCFGVFGVDCKYCNWYDVFLGWRILCLSAVEIKIVLGCFFFVEFNMKIMLNFLFIDLTEDIWSFIEGKFVFNCL